MTQGLIAIEADIFELNPIYRGANLEELLVTDDSEGRK
jgi:hypothetical protein